MMKTTETVLFSFMIFILALLTDQIKIASTTFALSRQMEGGVLQKCTA